MSKRFSVTCILCLLISACGRSGPVLRTPAVGSVASAPAPAPVGEPSKAVLEVRAPSPPADQPWISAAAESQYLFTGSEQHKLGVWVEAPTIAARAHVPSALALSIDTSGSMEGEKLANARRAARSLIEKMHDGDIVSIETFSDAVTLRAVPTRLDAQSRARLLSIVAELSAQGGTNLFDGVRSAEERALQAPDTHPVRRVIVISDGQATVGQTSPTAIGALADLGTAHGVQVTALGVGLDYDESALNILAERSSGRLFHIGSADQLAGIMEKEMALLEATVATQAFVEIVPAPGVQLIGIEGAQSKRSERGTLIVPIGTLYGGQGRELAVHFRASPGEGRQALLSARLHFADPSRGGLERVQEQIVSARFTNSEAVAREHRDSRVQEIVARHDAVGLARSAAQKANSGDLAAADKDLERAEQKLKSGLASAKGHEKERLSRDVRRVAEARSQAKAAAAAPAAMRPKAARAGSLQINDLSMDMAGY